MHTCLIILTFLNNSDLNSILIFIKSFIPELMHWFCLARFAAKRLIIFFKLKSEALLLLIDFETLSTTEHESLNNFDCSEILAPVVSR